MTARARSGVEICAALTVIWLRPSMRAPHGFEASRMTLIPAGSSDVPRWSLMALVASSMDRPRPVPEACKMFASFGSNVPRLPLAFFFCSSAKRADCALFKPKAS